MEVKFKQWHCQTEWHRYRNGYIALTLIASGPDAEMMPDVPIATATLNIEAIPLGQDEILVKDYAENEGMVDALITAGIVEPTTTPVEVGAFFSKAARCRLTPAALAECRS